MDTAETLGSFLSERRTEMGLAQTEVARLAKITPSYLSRIEHDERGGLSAEVLAALCGALGLSPEEHGRALELAAPVEARAA